MKKDKFLWSVYDNNRPYNDFFAIKAADNKKQRQINTQTK